MAGAMGWSAADVREASLAELWTHWIGWARAQGAFADHVDTSAGAVARLDALMERYPD
jgi:hypothetical protein